MPAEAFEEDGVVEAAFQFVECSFAEVGLVGQFAVGVAHVEEECAFEEFVVAVGGCGSQVVFDLFGHLGEECVVDGEGDAEDGVHAEVAFAVGVVVEGAVGVHFGRAFGHAEGDGAFAVDGAVVGVEGEEAVDEVFVVEFVL